MASVINTNISSLNAQRNLTTSQSALATSLQRLSSGLRINSAKDDAAGLAISERFSTQIRGMNVAARNANDGISLAQSAEGAMTEISNNLQRIRELAVQSRNATNSSSDRAALNAEAQQLKAEVDRVAETTAFNGTKLLDGNFTNQAFQVGANQGETINIAGIVNAQSAALGAWTSVATTADVTTYTQTTGPLTVTDGALATSIDINGESVSIAASGGRTAGDALTALVAAFNTAKADTANNPGLANVSMAADGAITSTDASLALANVTNLAGVTNGTTAGTATTTAVTTAGTAQTGFATLDISTTTGADNAILAMDGALTALNSARADMGAVQNRFTSVVASLQTTSENLSASRSRILDTDFAAETANLTRGQILQQAGTAMLAQANSLPNGVLALLRG